MLSFARKIPRSGSVLQHRLGRYFSSEAPVNLRIVFGSQSGTAEAFANELEFDAQEASINAEIIDALKFKAEDMINKPEKNTVTAFVFACYGEGEPTDNAKKFYNSIINLPSAEKKFQNSKFAVFGLGNSQCFRDRFNVIGKNLDRRLEELGGTRILPFGVGDASPEKNGNESMGEVFTAWKQKLINKVQHLSADTEAAPSSNENQPTTVSGMDSLHPSPMHFANVPIALSTRQQAMVPSDRLILHSTVSHVTQLFARTDEVTEAVEVEFDLPSTSPLYGTLQHEASYYTQGLQPGDHIGVFAPNSQHVVQRFALAAGLTNDDLDALNPFSNEGEENVSLRQVLTWQTHLSGVASLISIKLLQRWLKDQPGLPLTTKLFSQLESKYDSLVKDKGLDTAAILDMIPKLPGKNNSPPPKLPIQQLLKTLPTLNPRLYSITHMVLPSERAAATAAASSCPITKRLQEISTATPTAADDYTKITLLCRLLRYRQTKSSANRVVDGVCSSYLCERIIPGESKVAIFFRESNFHLPAPLPASSTETAPPVIMISGGSGIAPFMSFLEERQRQLQKPDIKIGPAVLYFGCRTNDEYIFRSKLVSYLGGADRATRALDRLKISFSSHQEDSTITTTESLHPLEILNPKEEHIPFVFQADKDYLMPLIREGAYIYVCGGAGQFGKAVREAVNTVVMEAHEIKPTFDSQGKEIIHPGIRHLIQNKRYFEDLAD